MVTKLSLQDAAKAPGVTPFGALTASDSDFDWLQSLREHEAEANYDKWFAEWFDRAAPAQKELALQLDPSFAARRKALADADIELARKLVHLKIFGVQSREDMILQYACEAGFIDADRIEHLLHPERAALAQEDAANQIRYARGLFNPRRLPRGDFGGHARATNAQKLLGKDESAFGPTPAYKLGTGDHGFSAVGGLTSATEMFPSFDTQMASIKKVNFA